MILLCNLLLLLSICSSSFFLFSMYKYSTIYLFTLPSLMNLFFTVTLLLPLPVFSAFSLRPRFKSLASYPRTPDQVFQSYSPRILPSLCSTYSQTFPTLDRFHLLSLPQFQLQNIILENSKVIMKGLHSNSNLKATKQSLEMPYQFLHKEYSKQFLHCSAQLHSCPPSFQLIAVYCTHPGSSNLISLNWEWRDRIGHYSNYPGVRWQCR